MMKLKTLWLLLPLVAAGCHGRDGKVAEKDILLQPVCTLEENLTPQGEPYSVDLAPDGSFVVTDLTSVVGYDPTGRQVFAWSKKGRGPYEYTECQRVRLSGDTVYVWDAASARLIAYDRDGNGLWTWDCGSGICDFLPAGSSIFIYPAGNRWEHIVEELDLETMSVVRSYGTSSFAQKVLHSMGSVAPMTFRDGVLYYMSKDKMDLYRAVPDGAGESALVESFPSDSFRCKELGEDLFAVNPLSGIEFLIQNSFVVSVIVDGASYKVLTIEGAANVGGQKDGVIKLENDERVIRLYRFGKDSRSVSSMEASLNLTLIAERNGDFYALEEGPGGAYRLVTLK